MRLQMMTLFMPNNQAFGTVDPSTLGLDVNDLIYNVHAVKGMYTSQQLRNPNNTIHNLAGSNITIRENQSKFNLFRRNPERQANNQAQFPLIITRPTSWSKTS